MKNRWPTMEQIKQSACAKNNPHLFEGQHGKEKKKSIYGNEMTEVDGINFHSKKEARRYGELKQMLKVGAIGMLQRQVSYELNPGGTHSYKYIADFVYIDQVTGEKIVEDVKGYRKKEYLKKRRLMKQVHNIEIKEV